MPGALIGGAPRRDSPRAGERAGSAHARHRPAAAPLRRRPPAARPPSARGRLPRLAAGAAPRASPLAGGGRYAGGLAARGPAPALHWRPRCPSAPRWRRPVPLRRARHGGSRSPEPGGRGRRPNARGPRRPGEEERRESGAGGEGGGGLARARFGNRAQGAVDRETVSGSAPPLTLSSLRRSRSRAALMRRWDCWCSCATCCSPSACSWCWAFCTTPPGSCTSSAGRTPVSTGAVPPRCPARSPSRRPGVGGTRRSPTGRGAVGARKGWSSASPDALGGFAFITGYESRLAPRVSSVTAAGPWGSLL